MREIKFRAWCPYKKQMKAPQSAYEMRDHFPAQCFDHLMQYTGLKDRNGKEIYEGDIVLYRGLFKDARSFAIEWTDENHSGAWTFHPMRDGEAYSFYYGDWKSEDFEVIGNIYENPELLEGEE